MTSLAANATDDRGRIRHYVGYWLNTSGKRVQRPFYFGSDPAEVLVRRGRVEELWRWIVKLHETPIEPRKGSLRFGCVREGKPVWNVESLWIAKQLATGAIQIPVTRPLVTVPDGRMEPQTDDAYAHMVKRLAKAFPMVYFVPEDVASFEAGDELIRRGLDRHLQDLDLATSVNLLPKKTESLHAALDAFIKHIPTESVEPTKDGPILTATGSVRLEHAKRLKSHHEDRPLSCLDFDGCQQLIDYWRNRPLTKERKGRVVKPMSRLYCKHHLDELKRFLKWLRAIVNSCVLRFRIRRRFLPA